MRHCLTRRVLLRCAQGLFALSYFNQLHAEGLSLLDRVTQGAKRRLRPVLMTAAVTAFGLIPRLFATGPGSEIQRPLAIVNIGSLITATAAQESARLTQRAFTLGEADLQALLLVRRQAADAVNAAVAARVNALRSRYRLLVDARPICSLEEN